MVICFTSIPQQGKTIFFLFKWQIFYVALFIFSLTCFSLTPQVQVVKPAKLLKELSVCPMTSTAFTSRWKSRKRRWGSPCRWLPRSTITHVPECFKHEHVFHFWYPLVYCREWLLIHCIFLHSIFSQKWIWVSLSADYLYSTMEQNLQNCWSPVRKTHTWSTAGWQTWPITGSEI